MLFILYGQWSMVNGQWFEEPSVSLAAVVSPMREVHCRLGGAKQDELMFNGQRLMVNGQ